MSIVSIQGNKVLPERDDQKFKAGDYVFNKHDLTIAPQERDIMQVRGYNTFGYVIVHFVRHKHRKYVPWHDELERDLVSTSDFGFYPKEV